MWPIAIEYSGLQLGFYSKKQWLLDEMQVGQCG